MAARPSASAANSAEQLQREAPAQQRLLHALLHGPHLVDGKVGIQLANLSADRIRQAGRLRRAAHHHVHLAHRRLGLRKIERDARIGVQRVLLDPPHHADDRDPRPVAASLIPPV